jgi:predicted O-methyltransferase YrrM
VGADAESQIAFVDSIVSPELTGRLRDRDVYAESCSENGAVGYGPVEAEFLYAFTCSKRPGKIIQVGAGVSTSVMLRAASDVPYSPTIVAIDPYPTAFLAGEGRIDLIQTAAQDVALDTLTDVSKGDLLFIDSTHTVKADSEVNRLILEVLPRLPAGVWVHFHDIFLPYDYQREVLEPPLFFWSESTLLHAFLTCNRKYSIAASLSMLHYAAPIRLQQYLPRYRPAANSDGLDASPGLGHFPSSVYLLAS